MKKTLLFITLASVFCSTFANSDLTSAEDITYDCNTGELRVNFMVGGNGHTSAGHNQYRYYDVGGGATVCLTSKPNVCKTFSCPNKCPVTAESANFTALATANAAGTVATITSGGLGYDTAPTVTVSGGTCTKVPTAVATIENKKVTDIELKGGKCTVAPTLTVAAPPTGTTITGYVDGVIKPESFNGRATGSYWTAGQTTGYCGIGIESYISGYVKCAGGPGNGTYRYKTALLDVKYDRSQCQTYACKGNKATNAAFCPGMTDLDKKIFTYTGSLQDLVIPANVTKIRVKLWGAGGGSENFIGTDNGASIGKGGPGGYTEATIPVTPGETLKVLVGQGGYQGCLNNNYTNPVRRSAYGFGGPDACDGGGGGLTGVFRTTASDIAKTDTAAALAIAGGGGGAATGAPGRSDGGSGNDTVNAGGQPNMEGKTDSNPIIWMGSGGGGYAGGELQSRKSTSGRYAGEGGTGYVIATAYARNIAFTPEFTLLTPPNTNDVDYVDGIGVGAYKGSTGATNGGPGRAVVYFVVSGGYDNVGPFTSDIDYTHRDNLAACTDAVKCEWYCPAATPFYCSASNSCTASATDCDDALSVEILDNESTLVPPAQDDMQTIDEGGTAKFFVRVKNNTPLFSYTDIVLSDLESTSCSRTQTETTPLIQGAKKLVGSVEQAGNNNTTLDPGEFFTYTCDRANVSFVSGTKTFADDDNDITLTGKRGTENVTSADDTKVYSDFLVIEKLDRDSTANPAVYDNTQIVDEGGTAKFLIRVKNNSTGATYNAMSIVDPETTTCSKTAAETLALLHDAKKLVNGVEQASDLKNNDVLDPGEFFSYSCDKANVTFTVGAKSFSDDDNDITLNAKRGTADVIRTSSSAITKSPVCLQTLVPSELKAGVDQPYIACTGNGDASKTHFRYRLTKVSGTAESAYILSQPVPITAPILHQNTLTEGNYTVECFYGTSSELATLPAAPHSCVKTMTVKPQTDLVQGCNKLYAFKGTVLGPVTDASAPYSATYRCSNRVSDLSATAPFKLKINNTFSTLGYDNNLSTYPVEDLGDGRTSLTLGQQIPIGQTSIECSVKVGEGYSTNSTCQAQARVAACTNVPLNGTLCAGSNIFVATATPAVYQAVCTTPNPPACQYTCTAPNPYYCPMNNSCVPDAAACIPLCTEGKYFCPLTNQCINKGVSCGDNTDGDTGNKCNNNNICDALEGCGCSDCAGWQDHCAAGLTCQYGGDTTQQQSQCFNENCTNTQAPSELKANVDQPYIACTGNGDVTKTHFRYKLSKISGTTAPEFISDIKLIAGGQVLHPNTLTEGSYRVECYYGTASSVLTDNTNVPHSCTKTMVVKPENDNNVQGCSRIYGYKGSTLSDDMTSTASSFQASFRCGSRVAVSNGTTYPYKLHVGSIAPITLEYDQIMSAFLNGFEIGGPVSLQSGMYNITDSQEIRCDVKVGNGYSTNNSCRIHACAGGATCTIPTTFTVVPSKELYCTADATTEYRIGCNPLSADFNTCKAKFPTDPATFTGTSPKTITMQFLIAGVSENRTVTCSKYIPEGSINEVVTCTTELPTGQTVSIFTSDLSLNHPNTYQSIEYISSRDTTAPVGNNPAPIYYTTSESTQVTPSSTVWFKTPVTAKIVCNNVANGTTDPDTADDACLCAPQIRSGTTAATADTTWMTPSPASDTTAYYKTFTASTTGSTWYVADTANNVSPAISVSQINIDMDAPDMTTTPTISGASPNQIVRFKFRDTVSGITEVKYLVGTASTMTVNPFNDNCEATGSASYTISGDNKLEQTVDVSGFSSGSQKIAYCVKDTAGNNLRGTYPSTTVGCFSASNMSPVPTLTTYATPLIARLTATTPQYGYGMSESSTVASCFRSLLYANAATYVSSQYTATPASGATINWTQPAYIKNSSNIRNTNGYYYFTSPAPASTTSVPYLRINSVPTDVIAPVKTVLVDGADIQIDTDLSYTGNGKLLILIAKKNVNGVGGNIIIKPGVERIDAILIADGSLLNGTDGVVKNWIDNASDVTSRLVINGRLYSLNTRGGSLVVSGGNLTPVTGTQGKFIDMFGAVTTVGAATLSYAPNQDLERFRYIGDDGIAQCSLHINYLSIPSNQLPPIMIRPSGFSGTCGF